MPLFPHSIATRRRHALGTRTVTGPAFAWTTSPAFRQNPHGRVYERTTWARYAGGTDTTLSTTRWPPA